MLDLDHTTGPNPEPTTPRQRLAPGTILGDGYEIVRSVAAGGFGAVYEARHQPGNRRVAVKVLHAWLADDPKTRERFRRELQAPAQIAHPGIVEVLDADVDPSGIPFLVMDWLEGETLRERLGQGPLSLTELRDVFDPFLDALDAAHTAGFVHRDLKPENCILTRDADGVERPRIVDFGLARKTGARSVTVTGTSLGTPRYMSPEQFVNAKVVGPESDVWAVGAMMYEALVGEPPFVADRPHALMLQILTEAHPPLKTRLPHLSPRLAALIERCLDKEPGRRPPDARALRSLFLGAYAAISGGLALRTIPEMPKTDAAEHAARPPDSESRRRRAEAPTESAHPPTRGAPPTPAAPSTTSSRAGALLWVSGAFAALGLLAAIALGIFLILGRSVDHEPPVRRAPPAPIPPPTLPAPAPMQPVLTPIAPPPREPASAPPAESPPAPTRAPEGDRPVDPLRPLTEPLDRLIFQ